MAFLEVVCFIGTIILLIYLYSKWIYTYWNRRGVYTISKRGYFELKAKGLKHGGYYQLMQPTFMTRDLDVIQTILIKKFDHFVNRGIFYNGVNDPLSVNLVSIENDAWRNLRNKLSPTFTSGKMKMMFNLMNECADVLNKILDHNVENNTPVEMNQMARRFGIDVIGSCAFGIDCKASIEENSEFLYYTKDLNSYNWRRMLAFTIPRELLVSLRFRSKTYEIENFYTNLVKNMINYRETNNVVRKDFLQLLMQLRDKGEISEDDNSLDVSKSSSSQKYMSLPDITSQCYMFFNAGFLTSSTAVAFTLLELAQNEDVQDKLRKEIFETLEKDGEFTYENVTGMTYLGQVVNESLRKHPPARGTQRVCNKEFKIPNSDITLQPGTRLSIPTLGIHRDPDIYPDPEKFDPERFTPENVAKRHPMAFLPFGEGPRICIGFRFALLEIKLAVAKVIKDFVVTLNEKTMLPIKYDGRTLMLEVKGGIWLNLTKVKSN